MSALSTPYKHSKTKRKEAFLDRYFAVAPGWLDLNYDKAVYERIEVYNNDNGTIRYPFIFEAVAIPKPNTREGDSN
jgi:hypothetical protein